MSLWQEEIYFNNAKIHMIIMLFLHCYAIPFDIQHSPNASTFQLIITWIAIVTWSTFDIRVWSTVDIYWNAFIGDNEVSEFW